MERDVLLQVGHLAGRFDALETKVGDMHADIRTLLARESERDGAKKVKKEHDESRLKRFAIYAAGLGGVLTMVAHQIGVKLGLLS